MPARRATLYITPPIDALLDGRQERDTLAGRLSAVAERYRMIIDGHKPDLTEAEWNACRDALNSYWMGDADSITLIWATIADADRIDGLGKKWGIDAQALSSRIRQMPPAELVALVEAVETWWAGQG